MGVVLRVDTGSQAIFREPLGQSLLSYGGRALITQILLAEVAPTCDPLGPRNKLVIAPGLLGGTSLSSAGRLSIGGKSPLTGGIKESNVGGSAGDQLARMDIRAIVFEGAPREPLCSILLITKDSASFVSTDELRGLGTYKTARILRGRFGDGVGVICIGPAGEMRLGSAGIAVTEDLLHQPGRLAARGGLGAVMGSKGIKAIVVDANGADGRSIHDEDRFKQLAARFGRELIESPKTGKEGSMHRFGTAAIMDPVNEIGALPTRNFSQGSFEGVDRIGPGKLRSEILQRGGRMGQRCMAGCVIQCSNVFVDKGGEPIVSTLQYETLALMGSNLGIDDLDVIARLNRACNDLGVDTIEMGAAIGLAMEAGLADFGDGKAAEALLAEVASGSTLGRLLGNGAAVTGRVFGIRRIPVARGQAFPGYDPRALKGNGVTYATSAMGADHTAGNTIGSRKMEDPLSPKGKGQLSRDHQRIAAMLDMTGLCLFARPPVVADPTLMVDLLNACYGWEWQVADLVQAEDELLSAEREFNRRAGFSSVDDRLPEAFCKEPLPPQNAVFDVPEQEIADAVQGL